LPGGGTQETWTAPHAGIVTDMHAELVGRASVALGAGRDRVDAGVDHAAGIEILVRVGEPVGAGDPVLVLTAREQKQLDAARALLADAITIGPDAPARRPLIFDRLARESFA
jgi:pyrimidine-nucleoside phosphorylase